MPRQHWGIRLTILGGLLGLGYLLGTTGREQPNESLAETPTADRKDAKAKPVATYPAADSEAVYLRQSPGASVDRGDHDFGLGDGHISKLTPYPKPCREGDRTPFDLYRYGGAGHPLGGRRTCECLGTNGLSIAKK